MSSFGEHGIPSQNMTRGFGRLRARPASATAQSHYARTAGDGHGERLSGRPGFRCQRFHPASPKDSDKRIQPRFLAPCLKVTMRRRGWLGWHKESESVECVDINRYGAALITDQPVKTGSRIQLDFKGKYITQSDVCAAVVSQVALENGTYRLGIQFVYCIDRRSYSRAIDNALSQIEAFCRRRTARYRG